MAFFFSTISSKNLKKIKSFSHGEFNKENLNKKISKINFKNEDIFNRGFELKKIKIDESYPDYILKNKEKFSQWII